MHPKMKVQLPQFPDSQSNKGGGYNANFGCKNYGGNVIFVTNTIIYSCQC